MISDQIIKDEFISKTLKAGVNKIFTLQSEIAHQVLNERTGRLFASLDSRPFGLSGAGGKYMLSVNILNYLRFNEIKSDMNLRGKLHLYNRTVWGVLYGETLPTLKYGFTDEMRELILKQLTEAGVQLEIPFKI